MESDENEGIEVDEALKKLALILLLLNQGQEDQKFEEDPDFDPSEY